MRLTLSERNLVWEHVTFSDEEREELIKQGKMGTTAPTKLNPNG